MLALIREIAFLLLSIHKATSSNIYQKTFPQTNLPTPPSQINTHSQSAQSNISPPSAKTTSPLPPPLSKASSALPPSPPSQTTSASAAESEAAVRSGRNAYYPPSYFLSRIRRDAPSPPYISDFHWVCTMSTSTSSDILTLSAIH